MSGENVVHNVRPEPTPPSFSIFSCCLLLSQHRLYATTYGSERVLENSNLVVSRHVFA